MGYLKKILPYRIYRRLCKITDRINFLHSQRTFSQEGEDILLDKIFNNQKKGFYVDVGAYHPVRFSNTYLLYRKGWKGINIDCNIESINKFYCKRKGDINIHAAISDKHEKLTYYIFKEQALSGCDHDISAERLIKEDIEHIRTVETQTLAEILDKNLPTDSIIDVLTIDTEGLDLKVLKSNNWEKYRPKIVLAEDLNFQTHNNIFDTPIILFMISRGYRIFAKTYYTIIFHEQDFNPYHPS